MVKHKEVEIRKEEILKAAERCIASEGYHQTTMDKIAEEAGLSKGTLYWYFNSKDEIVIELCNHMCNEHLKLLNEFQKHNLSIRDFTLTVGNRFLDLLLKEKDQYRIIFELWALAAENKKIGSQLGLIKKMFNNAISLMISDAVKRGELKSGIKANEVATVFLAMFDGIAVRYALDKTLNVKKVWSTAVEVYFDGIGEKP